MNILTRQEIEFLQKISAILEDYNAVLFYNGHGGIDVEMYLGGAGRDKPLGMPITLPATVDETDINELFAQLEQDVEIVEKERAAGLYKGLHAGVLKQTNEL